MIASTENNIDASSSMHSEEDQQSAERAMKAMEALRRYRKVMYERFKDANLSAARNELDDYNKYSKFEITDQAVIFDDDSESNDIAQDLELLGL